MSLAMLTHRRRGGLLPRRLERRRARLRAARRASRWSASTCTATTRRRSSSPSASTPASAASWSTASRRWSVSRRWPTSAASRRRCCIRVTPGVEADTHDFIMTGAEDSKFGFGLQPGPRDAGGQARHRAARHRLRRPAHAHRQPDLRAAQLHARPSRSSSSSSPRSRPRPASRSACSTPAAVSASRTACPTSLRTIKEYGKVVVDGIKEECEKHGLTVPRDGGRAGPQHRRQRRRDALHRRLHQGDPEHPHLRRGRRRHVRQHPHRRSTTRTTRRSSPTRPTSRARWSRPSPASTARAATSSCNDAPLQCPRGRRHPVRVRDRRVLPVDEQQLQQAGAARRGVRARRRVALGRSAARPTTT